MTYCSHCGAPVSPKALACPACGEPLARPAKSKAAAALLCFFLGQFGIHRFYLRDYALGCVFPFMIFGGIFFTAAEQPIGAVLVTVGFLMIIVDFVQLLFRGPGYYQDKARQP